MVIRGSGPNLGNEFKTHSDFLVFLIQIISIILPIRVSEAAPKMTGQFLTLM